MTEKTIVKLIEKLIYPHGFSVYGEFNEYDFEDDFEYNDAICTLADFCTKGATKGVIKLPGFEEVIKIPFTGNDEYDWFGLAGYPTGNKDNTWDHCRTECDVYKVAELYGLERFFAKTEYIGAIYGTHPVYKQEFVTMATWEEEEEYEITHVAKINDTREKLNYKGYYFFNYMWLTEATEYYGEDAIYNLLDFLERYKLDKDLHRSNLGYIKDGSGRMRPIILDYSGYFSDWDYSWEDYD